MKTIGIRLHLVMFLLVLAGATASPGMAGDAEFTEYDVKAAFIYNIAKFVEWPESNWPASKATITFCLIGNDPFGKALESIDGKTIKGKRLEIKRVSSMRELKDCQMAFISSSERDRAIRITEALKEYGTLTIGDTEGYVSQGVMVNFYMDGKKVRIEIDLEKARQAKLAISSQLLKVARIASERKQ